MSVAAATAVLVGLWWAGFGAAATQPGQYALLVTASVAGLLASTTDARLIAAAIALPAVALVGFELSITRDLEWVLDPVRLGVVPLLIVRAFFQRPLALNAIDRGVLLAGAATALTLTVFTFAAYLMATSTEIRLSPREVLGPTALTLLDLVALGLAASWPASLLAEHRAWSVSLGLGLLGAGLVGLWWAIP